MDLWSFLCRKSACATLTALTVASCAPSGIDSRLMAENTARYETKPLHKALYINGADYALYERVNNDSVQQALSLAAQDCLDGSKQRGSDPARCAPLYTDDVRLFDPAVYQ